jgi:23S rRNA (uracil1939-C5)-methyltransferase
MSALRVERLGDKGDGLASGKDGRVAVPYALPGETVTIAMREGKARLVSVEQPSPDRVVPECPLFTDCGGCAMQHLALPAQRAWKRGLVVAALARAGLACEVADCIDAHGQGRRRVMLHLRRADNRMRAGFMAAHTHRLVPVETCPILAPDLWRSSTIAETLAEAIGGVKPLDILVSATETGLDVDIRGLGKAERQRRGHWPALAETLDLARLSLHGDVVVERRRPLLRMGKALVAPPPGGFLQATRAGEETIAALVARSVTGASRVLDLFCGCGPFALRLAATMPVIAMDADAFSIAALLAAARATPGLKPVAAEARDLFRRPPLAKEMDGAAVIFDPPRAGAEAVARALAAAKVTRVVAVSCNVTTFVRDARILVNGGFTLESVTPIDQFRHAAHVELVAVFVR